MKRIEYFLLAVLLVGTISGFSQHPSDLPSVSANAAIIGKSSSEGVMLRWAPARFSVWQVAARNGWILERADWDENDWPYELSKLTFNELGRFRALDMNAWEENTDINDPYVAVAAQALFGNDQIKAMPSGALSELRLIADLQENRHALALLAADLSANAAKGLGLSYTDKSAKSGNDYVYRLRLENNKEGFGADTVYYFVQYDGTNELVPQVQSVVTEAKHAAVDVYWDKEFNRNFFTAYYVERSENKKDWQRLNKLPLTTATGDDQPDVHMYTDTTARIAKKYFYRVTGITPFAELSPSEDAVEGMARDLQGPVPPQHVSIEQLGNMFRINWDTELSLISPDLAGWKVKRSVVASGPYQELHPGRLPLKQNSFADEQPVPVMTNYYRVYAVDTANNETPGSVYSAVWVDSIPPNAPAGLYAVVDSTGIVTIQWTENSEFDLQGYRVFVRDDRQKEWYQLTTRPITESYFTDTVDLASLAESIEYSVVALDFHYNASSHSNPFLLRLPDLVAPSAPRWGRWTMEENMIRLSWYPSHADDVKSQLLYSAANEGTWVLKNSFAKGQINYTDTINGLNVISYALIAVDSSGNFSDTAFLRNIRSTYVDKLPSITKPAIKYLKPERAIEISWSYEDISAVNFVIYRKNLTGEEVEFAGNAPFNARSFRDYGPTEFNDGFDYYLKAISTDGRESEWVSVMKVRFVQ